MSLDEEDIRTLSKLGLTPTQAKIYLILLRTGKSNGKTLAKHSNVARQEVYRILGDLHETGLVEKIVGSPSEFKAIAIQDGISILLVNKAQEYKETEEKTKELAKKFTDLKEEAHAEDKGEFLLIPGKTMFFEKRKKMVENIRYSLKIITTEKRFAQAVHYVFENYKKALKRGVNIRIIVEKSEDEESFLKTVHPLLEYPNFSLKYITTPIKANVVIFDDKEAIVVVHPASGLAESPALWTNHQGLIAMYKDHFETVWKSALKYKPPET